MSSLEQDINYQLNKLPGIKKYIKRAYQLVMYAISPKIKSEGDIIRVSPEEPGEYFFGYYDKSPWNLSGRFMLCMRAKDTWSNPDPLGEADILLIDTYENNKYRKIATTHTWNVQQGCMAQWLGPDFSSRIIFNDLRDGKYCSVIKNVHTLEEVVLPLPVYTVSSDGTTSLSLDFSRLHNLRKGYGYAALPETTKGQSIPESTCIWKMNLQTCEVIDLLKYTDFVNFETRPEMKGAIHKVNHLMLSPDGKRFMILHRWFQGQRKYTRLVTCGIDGKKMYVLNEGGTSHCYWKDNSYILFFGRKDEGRGYYLVKDQTQEYVHLWSKIDNDGHPSYCPTDKSLVVTDSYPNRARVATLRLLKDTDAKAEQMKIIAKVFAPFKYDNDTRCDLHPRWSRDGKKICFDSVFEGKRGLYIVDIDE